MNKTKKSLIIFIIVTLSCGWFGVILDLFLTNQPKGDTLGMGVFLIAPLFTAIILKIVKKDKEVLNLQLNWKNNKKWYLYSFLVYPSVTLITVGIAILLQHANIETLDIKSFLLLAAISIGTSFIKNIFEEFAWRGYLTPKLISLKANDLTIYLVSGLTWSLWHGAYYLVFLPDTYLGNKSRIELLVMGCIIMICWTIMYVEIYRLTKSVWPCVIMHAMEDAVPNVLVFTGGYITFTKLGDILLNPITGSITTILLLVFGLYLRNQRIKNSVEK
jgi:Predicted protease of the Abi (CAAX) family